MTVPVDPTREAFRAELASIVADLSIPWTIKDVENVFEIADAQENFIALEFGGGSEEPMTFGSPGSNYWSEHGQVFVRVVAVLNSGHDAEGWAFVLRNAFRNRRFVRGDGREIRTNSGPTDGVEIGARWIQTVAVAYRTINVA